MLCTIVFVMVKCMRYFRKDQIGQCRSVQAKSPSALRCQLRPLVWNNKCLKLDYIYLVFKCHECICFSSLFSSFSSYYILYHRSRRRFRRRNRLVVLHGFWFSILFRNIFDTEFLYSDMSPLLNVLLARCFLPSMRFRINLLIHLHCLNVRPCCCCCCCCCILSKLT
jgi:hypothetical protein